jgi:hypothetical protein
VAEQFPGSGVPSGLDVDLRAPVPQRADSGGGLRLHYTQLLTRTLHIHLPLLAKRDRKYTCLFNLCRVVEPIKPYLLF